MENWARISSHSLNLKRGSSWHESGICAGKSVANALILDDISESGLSYYQTLIDSSNIYRELYPIRNSRAVMRDGILIGGLKVALQLFINENIVKVPEIEPDMRRTEKDLDCTKPSMRDRFGDKLDFDNRLTFSKENSLFYSNIEYDENQPLNLVINNREEFQKSNIEQFGLSESHFCPADVYELHIDSEENRSLRIHPENCLHCKSL